MPIVKRYTFQPRVSAGLASQFNTNFDDIIDAFNNHKHSGVGTDAPNITISGIQDSTLAGLKALYVFNVYRTAALTPNLADIIWDTKVTDTTNSFNTSNGRYVCPITGYYQLNANITFGTVAANIGYGIAIRKNGAILAATSAVMMYAGAYLHGMAIATTTYAVAGDYFSVNDPGGCNRPLQVGVGMSSFSGHLIGAA